MAVSIIYLDDHGKRVAERVSDITYKSEHIGYRKEHDDDWVRDRSDNNLLVVCGSDKIKTDVKFKEDDFLAYLYVKIREFGSPRQQDEKNTVYISPEENGLTEDEYYSLCYRQAEDKIRKLAEFASVDNLFIILDMADFRNCFSDAYFVDVFTIEKPDLSHFEDAVNEMASRCREMLNGLEDARALIRIQVPENTTLRDYDEAMVLINQFFHKSKTEIGFNENGESSISITAAITCGHPLI